MGTLSAKGARIKAENFYNLEFALLSYTCGSYSCLVENILT